VLRELGLDEIPIAGWQGARRAVLRGARPVILAPTSSALYLVQRIRMSASVRITTPRLAPAGAVKSAFDDLPGWARAPAALLRTFARPSASASAR